MKIVVSCHGNVAEEIIKSAEMIVGEIEDIFPVSFMPGEGREDLLEKYSNLLGSAKDDVIFLCDVFGGSPYNAAFEYVFSYEADVISGVSLPLLIDVCELRQKIESPKEIFNSLNKEFYINHIQEV